jgi:hypothetical protein
MRFFTHSTRSFGLVRRQARARHLLMLFLFGWMNLIVQPCQAELPAMPMGMEHCDHGSAPDHAAVCPAMQAVDCKAPAVANADAPPPVLSRTISAIAVLPVMADVAGLRSIPSSAATGPPIPIFFCSLRN